MGIVAELKPVITAALNSGYHQQFDDDAIAINITKPEFEGDYTLVLFSFIKQLKRKPEEIGKEIGEKLLADHPDLFTSYNVIKAFKSYC